MVFVCVFINRIEQLFDGRFSKSHSLFYACHLFAKLLIYPDKINLTFFTISAILAKK